MRIALYQPDIPQNAGTLIRTGACLGLAVDIIGPAGFDVSDRALARAGLDYAEKAAVRWHESFVAFEQWRRDGHGGRLVLLTTKADRTYTEFNFAEDDILLLGRESAGVPQAIHDLADARLAIPLRAGLRSLNIAVAAAMVIGEALRQVNGWPR